jgi:creatinine amidohydrolase
MVYDCIGDDPHSWGGLTAGEVNETASAAGSVAVVPVGSVEQHADHMPTGTDTILVDAVAHAAVERLDDDVPVLLTPPVWSGLSPHHMSFGGTITLSLETLLHVVEDVAGSAIETGFDAVLLLNGHGGNASLVSSATTSIGEAYPDAEALAMTYLSLIDDAVEDTPDRDDWGHAGQVETSLMLHLRPELVDLDRASVTVREEPYEEQYRKGNLTVYRRFDEFTEAGSVGDGTAASAAYGERLLDGIGRELSAVLEDVHENNR